MHPIFLHCESKNPSLEIPDFRTQKLPFAWRGADITLLLALTTNGLPLVKANVGTLIIEIKNINDGPAAECLYRTTRTSSSCDAAFSAETWKKQTKVLLTLSIAAADVAFAPGSYRLIVRHEKDGKNDTFLSAKIHLIEDASDNEDLSMPAAIDGFIRFGSAQDLTLSQQAQARTNANAAMAPLVLSTWPENATQTGIRVTYTGATAHFAGDYLVGEDGFIDGRPYFTNGYYQFQANSGTDGWDIIRLSDDALVGGSGTGTLELTPDLVERNHLWGYIPGGPDSYSITDLSTPGTGTAGTAGQIAVINEYFTAICLRTDPVRWSPISPAYAL